jgi:hypothetical protein
MRILPLTGILGILLLGAGCGTQPHSAGEVDRLPKRGERVALIPFDNLTEYPDASRRYTLLLFDRLTGERSLDLVPLAEVEPILAKYRVRRADLIDSTAARSMGEDLQTRYLIVGTVLDMMNAADSRSRQAELTVSLRIHSLPSGQVVWTCVDARSGNDGERPFGWGVILSADKLAAQSVDRIVENLNGMLQDQQKR